ncbi:aminotransferase class I/II-fold pyridoxal phosphate-dependent enzyme [Inhella gelatinilytica]|uniref:8-amino-7-oxononanoate synthase n=1 Tax=Inhella gelatinilytica TaxID=2795030 RepID=A0A931ISN3_9BURK|nr:8-amino-7-oxononanoate synthase [Inhella gelatinilytica]MBH9551277.1 8-amino-7-oxononanoate synthase [Inhella gelatinilytica]
MSALFDRYAQQLAERAAQDLIRVRRVAASPTAPRQVIDGVEKLLFCSNDYLGLADHPELIAALQEGAARWGVGSGASHLISGHSQAHEALEAQLARWARDCIPDARALTLCTGYMANLALLTGLGDREDAELFSERLNHASLIDGARLARARKSIYADLDQLEGQLRASTAPTKLIVTDAVFSMDGHLAPLRELLALAERFDALLLVDDAHGFGVLGPHGHGSLAHSGLRSERLVWMGTLGKAAGVAGAFIAAHPTLIEWLLQTSRPTIFTTASPPALAHALVTSLALIEGEEGERRRDQLDLLRAQLVDGLAPIAAARGWQLPRSDTPIQPLIVGENAAALALSARLDAQGLRVPAIRPPTVPAGTARLRITLCADHEAQEIDDLLAALVAST